MSKYCGNCGKEITENQNVCSNCGAKIEYPVTNKVDKNALAGFVLGLVSIIAWIIPLFGYPVTICGIVFSCKGLKSEINKNKAIAGLILSIIFLVFSLANSCLGVLISFQNNFNY